MLGEFTRRRAAAFEGGREALLAYVADAATATQFASRGAEYLAAIGSQTNLGRPASWKALLEKGASLDHAKAKTMLLRIRARLGDADQGYI